VDSGTFSTIILLLRIVRWMGGGVHVEAFLTRGSHGAFISVIVEVEVWSIWGLECLGTSIVHMLLELDDFSRGESRGFSAWAGLMGRGILLDWKALKVGFGVVASFGILVDE
jgi:hypothetical protein